jgi:Txe/YoeB family toxin of Txe-Axe toxin-antitoxin module
MAQRIKGQDVVVQIMSGGNVVSQFADIRNFEVTPKFEKLEEQYLGETSKRYDEIFHGVDFKMDVHLETEAVFTFVNAIKTRAQSRAGVGAAAVINIQATLYFGNGQKRNVTLANCYFEDIPFSVGGRSEYVQTSFSGSCTDIKVAA